VGCGSKHHSLWLPASDINLDALAYQSHSGFVRHRPLSGGLPVYVNTRLDPGAGGEPSVSEPESRVKFSTPYASITFRLRSALPAPGVRPGQAQAVGSIDRAALPARPRNVAVTPGVAQSALIFGLIRGLQSGRQRPVTAASLSYSTGMVTCQVICTRDVLCHHSVQK
jgi:hypothetical protein